MRVRLRCCKHRVCEDGVIGIVGTPENTKTMQDEPEVTGWLENIIQHPLWENFCSASLGICRSSLARRESCLESCSTVMVEMIAVFK